MPSPGGRADRRLRAALAAGETPNGAVPRLIGQDRINGAPGQAPDYDWPNPTQAVNRSGAVRMPDTPPDRSVALLLGHDRVYGLDGQVPAYDWQRPTLPVNRTGAQRAQDALDAQGGRFGDLFVGHDRVYGPDGMVAEYDWPNPTTVVNRAAAQRSLDALGTRFANLYAVLQAPLLPLDWPNPRLADTLARRRSQADLAPLSPLRNPSSAHLALGNPVAAQMNTTFTNDLSADGFTWAQGTPSFSDKYGNLITLVQRHNAASKLQNFVYSNTNGASWTDAGIAEAAIDRGACAYDQGHDLIHVAYNGQDVSDGIFYRRYLISYTAGTKQINGIARLDSVSVILDNQQAGEAVQYRHPSAVFCEDVTLSGEATTGNTLVIVYGISNTNVANPGSEVRAVARALSYDSGDGTAANWRSVTSAAGAPSGSSTLIGNAPVTGSYRRLTGTTTDTQTPCPTVGRVPFEGSTKGGIFAYWGRPSGVGRAFLTYSTTAGAVGWTVGSATTLDNLPIAGSDAGYNLKHQLLSKITFDPTNKQHYLAYPVWKSDALGDVLRVSAFNSLTFSRVATLDLYAAGPTNTDGLQDMFVAGDVQWDDVSGALVIAYGDLPRHDVYVATATKDLALVGAAPLAIPSAFTTAPCDIPTIHPARVGGKTALVFRDFNAGARTNPPTYTPPYTGWWLTLDWVDPRPAESAVYWHPSAQRWRPGALDSFVDLQSTLLGVLPTSPVTPLDWALPPPARPRRQLDVGLDLLATTLLGQDVLYGPPGMVGDYDWPNPLVRRVQQPEQPLDLQSTLLFVVPPVPLLPYDWPNPLRPAIWARPINRDQALGLVLGTLLGQDGVYGAPGQVPPYAWTVPPGPRRPVQPEIPASLQGTLLFVVPPVPMLPLDWPNPLRREPTRETRTFLATGYPLQLRGQDALYGPPGLVPAYDWTGVPKGRPPGVVTNRAHLVNLVLQTLANQDRVYGTFGQAPTRDLEMQGTTPRGRLLRAAATWRAVLAAAEASTRTGDGIVFVSLGSVTLAVVSPAVAFGLVAPTAGLTVLSPGVAITLEGE